MKMKENHSTKLNDGYFSLPCKWNLSSLLNSEEKIAVVSIVGQSDAEANCDKTHILSMLLGCSISSCNSMHSLQIDESLVHLEGWYDSSRRIIFLHLVGALDIAFLTSGLPKIEELFEKKGSILGNSELDQQYQRALLFVFSLSHLVLWCNTSHRLDTTTITTLRTLNNIRLEVVPEVSKILQECRINRTWCSTGRLCCPRLLFLFSSALLDPEDLAHSLSGDSCQHTTESALKMVEQGLEDQIYRLFRRTWIITNNCNNSIASLPSNHQYVYLLSPHQLHKSTQSLAAERLRHVCNDTAPEVPEMQQDLGSVGLSASDNVALLLEGGGLDTRRRQNRGVLDVLATHLLADDVTDTTANTEHLFSQYLMQHITQALHSGFDDNIGRGASTPIFLLPKAKNWFTVANRLYSFFIRPETDRQASSAAVTALTFDSPQVHMLRNSCEQAYEAALEHYKGDLPQHYPHHLHLDKLRKSLLEYSALGCGGPFARQFEERLERECEAVWRDNRRGCEQLSLSGHNCQHSLHLHPTAAAATSQGEELPTHSFGVSFLKYCNCGHRLGKMNDSTALRHMNHTFYAEMEEMCCDGLETWHFPCVQIGSLMTHTKAIRPAKDAQSNEERSNDAKDAAAGPTGLTGVGAIAASLHERQLKMIDAAERTENVFSAWDTPSSDSSNLRHQQSLDTAPQGEQSNSSSGSPYDEEDENYPHDRLRKRLSNCFSSENVEAESDVDKQNRATYVRVHSQQHQQHDHKENLHSSQLKYEQKYQVESMLCSSSPPGFLPLYSSWSLVCVGASSLYSHNAGIIDQPGFTGGSNFLLPWDVKMMLDSTNHWVAMSDSVGKKAKAKTNVVSDGFWVKIFLGMEYECCRGHRFLMSSTTKMMRNLPSHPTLSAHAIATGDMPLYHPCFCSESSGEVVLGQLMRLHLVTPKMPVTVQLNPQVQPGPAPCPRYFPQDSGNPSIKLSPASYWVLRLPNIYIGETGPYYPPDPSQPVGVENGRLLAGCFLVTELCVDK